MKIKTHVNLLAYAYSYMKDEKYILIKLLKNYIYIYIYIKIENIIEKINKNCNVGRWNICNFYANIVLCWVWVINLFIVNFSYPGSLDVSYPHHCDTSIVSQPNQDIG